MKLKDDVKLTYVILPVYNSDSGRLEEIIENGVLKEVMYLLNPTLKLDGDLSEEIAEVVINKDKGNGISIYRRKIGSGKLGAVEDNQKLKNIIQYNKNLEMLNEWEQMYLRLKSYLEEYKRILYYDENDELYMWMENQITLRKEKKLSGDQVNKLNSINFIWNMHKLRWEGHFYLLVKFREENNEWPTNKDNARLYNWTCSQRDAKRKNMLEEYRINKLESIGFIWDILKELFMNNYNLLRGFLKNNNGQYPNQKSSDTVEKGLYTFIKVIRDRHLEGKLEEYKEVLLDKIGLLYNREQIWEYGYSKTKQWINVNGRFPKSNIKDNEEKSAYRWFKNQSNNYVNGTLTIEQKRRLNKINVKEFIQTVEENRKKKATKTHEELISVLKIYYDEHGHLPVYSEETKTNSLAAYCTKLRKAYEKRELAKEEISVLENMNFKFDISKINNNKFIMMCHEIKQFRKANQNKWPSIYGSIEERKLAMWLNNQKNSFKKENLHSEKIAKLQKLGVEFEDLLEKKWNENYEKVKKLKDDNPYYKIPTKIDGKNNPLYTWYSNQKQALKNGKLSPEKIEILERIGIYI